MQTLTYGRKKPGTGDKGAVVFTALEDNITRDDAHDHDGTDSTLLTPKSTPVGTVDILAGSWAATSNGQYRQVITLPGGYDYDKVTISVKDSNGHINYLTIEKINVSSFYVYCNDNTFAGKAVISS
jgi:hypothetical protein